MPSWRPTAYGLLDLVIAQQCAGCDRPGTPWCPDCARAVAGPPRGVPAAVALHAAAAHDGPAGRAVVAFKERGQRCLASPLAALLAGAVVAGLTEQPGPGPVWLIPVPSRRSARRSRGFDPVALLAARAAAHLRGEGHSAHRLSALCFTGEPTDQVGLGREQRATNLAGTMALRAHGGPRGLSPALPAGRLVLVDDVTTTGATLAEGLRALGAGTWRRTLAATVTRSTWRRGPGIG